MNNLESISHIDNKEGIQKHFYEIHQHEHENSTLLGFWIYLMSDCLIFAVLFAAYAVLGKNYADSSTGAELFNLPLVALNTVLLLISSVTNGFSILQMNKNKLFNTMFWLGITGLIGSIFIGLELYEFIHLIAEGESPQKSGFLTSFFTLVGTHGLHVFFGIIWLITLMLQIRKKGLSTENNRRLICLSMFWHFLDVVWIFVFTFVYLIGSMS